MFVCFWFVSVFVRGCFFIWLSALCLVVRVGVCLFFGLRVCFVLRVRLFDRVFVRIRLFACLFVSWCACLHVCFDVWLCLFVFC